MLDGMRRLAPILVVAAGAAGCGVLAPEAAAPLQTVEREEPVASRPEGRQRGLRFDEARASGLRPSIARHAAANGVPTGLAEAVIRVESRYNPRAANAGNYGLMQIRLATAKSLGYAGGPGGLLDAETNLRFGMKYLGEAHKLAGGDVCRTVMKYQSGHRAIRLSAANRAYCTKVKAIMAGRMV